MWEFRGRVALFCLSVSGAGLILLPLTSPLRSPFVGEYHLILCFRSRKAALSCLLLTSFLFFFFLVQQPLSDNHSSQPFQMKPVCHEAGDIQMPIWIDLQPGPHPLSSNTSSACPDATVQPCTQKKSLFLSLAEESSLHTVVTGDERTL